MISEQLNGQNWMYPREYHLKWNILFNIFIKTSYKMNGKNRSTLRPEFKYLFIWAIRVVKDNNFFVYIIYER